MGIEYARFARGRSKALNRVIMCVRNVKKREERNMEIKIGECQLKLNDNLSPSTINEILIKIQKGRKDFKTPKVSDAVRICDQANEGYWHDSFDPRWEFFVCEGCSYNHDRTKRCRDWRMKNGKGSNS